MFHHRMSRKLHLAVKGQYLKRSCFRGFEDYPGIYEIRHPLSKFQKEGEEKDMNAVRKFCSSDLTGLTVDDCQFLRFLGNKKHHRCRQMAEGHIRSR